MNSHGDINCYIIEECEVISKSNKSVEQQIHRIPCAPSRQPCAAASALPTTLLPGPHFSSLLCPVCAPGTDLQLLHHPSSLAGLRCRWVQPTGTTLGQERAAGGEGAERGSLSSLLLPCLVPGYDSALPRTRLPSTAQTSWTQDTRLPPLVPSAVEVAMAFYRRGFLGASSALICSHNFTHTFISK